MAEDWTAIAGEVAAAIGDVGFAATHRREIAGVPDPQQPWIVAIPTITDTAVMIISGDFRFDEIDGTTIQAQDRKVMIEARGVYPSPEDDLIIGGKVYEIVTVKPLDPGGVPVLFEVQIRA